MSTLELAIPTDGDSSKWTDREKALVEAAGLVSRGNLAPRPTVEAFLSHCHRTGLDPIARQIYCIERGGKWTTQISIDGARLVAERSKQYQGQTPTEWTADGITWVQVWLSKDNPAAARVGVYRAGFQAPLYAVATWDAYNAGSPIWKKMPALMLGKCAEMLALRKAFPQDLSGLYSAEEMDQASPSAAPVSEPQASAQPPAPEVRQPSRDWLADANAAKSRDELRPVYAAAQEAGDLDVALADGRSLKEFLWELRESLPETVEDIVDAEVVDETTAEQTTDWTVAEIPNGEPEA
ncbi:phage recombination protein Bet [Microbacterium maritypicum]|uniref:Phage recombination protein Bet n=2 Tax=Microbacterium maritypicum TaxID=33918 RepID=A0ACD4B7L2_MICMQ|nr:phage recombination protein Bet [Microbacterium liquefaciens]UTT53775.1 phage recombination protein Bet [Microbacterium liquefaciens]UTT53840.1 phage recombination protein Bet [Microbacterium liquefaciens]